MWTWGSNTNYEMGNGTTTNISIPTQINNETNWESISSRGSHVEALKSDKSIYHWGANYGILPATIVTTPIEMANNCLLSVENFHSDLEVQLFPNPANQIVTINNKSNQKITSIVFIDMVGKEIFTLNKNFESINVEKLENGMYLVIINFEEGLIKTVKFIKK